MIITWTKSVDLSDHMRFEFGNVVRANGRNYAVVSSDVRGITGCLANDQGEPIDAAKVTLPWHMIKELHIY